MKFVLLLVYTSCFFYKIPCIKGEYMIEQLYDACPHNNFCSDGNKSLPEGHHSCCAECSCDDGCSTHGNCCPDSGISNNYTVRPCRLQSEYFDLHRQNVFIVTGYGNSYYVVDTCQDGYDEDTVTGCLHPRSLEEHTLVSDINYTVIYKNEKCAQCNGIQTYNTWDLVVHCKYDESLDDFYEREDYILDQCSLASKPPDQLKDVFESLRCSPHKISSCNETRKWDFYDSELETACKSIDMEFTEEIVIKGEFKPFHTYANVFCYMCNKKRGTTVQPICRNKGDAQVKGGYFGLAPFTAVFNRRKKQVIEERKCRLSEMEDPLLRTCTQLLCPFGKTAVSGECTNDLQYIYLTMSASFKVQFMSLENQDSDSELEDELADALLKEVRQTIYAASCGFCGASLFRDSILDIRTFQTPRCTISKLLRVLEYFSKMKIMPVSIHNQHHDVYLKHTGEYSEDRNERNARHIGGERCQEGVKLKPKFYCKRLVYSVRELTDGRINNETIEHLMQVSDLHDDSPSNSMDHKYVICLKDYILHQNTALSFRLEVLCLWTSPIILLSRYF